MSYNEFKQRAFKRDPVVKYYTLGYRDIDAIGTAYRNAMLHSTNKSISNLGKDIQELDDVIQKHPHEMISDLIPPLVDFAAMLRSRGLKLTAVPVDGDQ